MRSPTLRLCLALLLAPAPALAGWSSTPTPIRLTTATIPIVEACSDGDYGTLVFWQESGLLRALHVLPSGDIDPAWPADGAVVCNVDAARADLELVPDGAGGAYAVWREGWQAFVTRVGASGAVAANWPARGRYLGPCGEKPSVIADGAGGIYVAWSDQAIKAIHLGPGNTGAGGWPNSTRTLSMIDIETWNDWPSLALAADGGVYVAWATVSSDPAFYPNAWRLRRLTPSGLSAAGWNSEGIALAPFQVELVQEGYATGGIRASWIAAAADGEGGAYVMRADPTMSEWGPVFDYRLQRVDSDGGMHEGWDPLGRTVGSGHYEAMMFASASTDASVQARAHGQGSVYIGQPFFYDHMTTLEVRERTGSHAGSGQGNITGFEWAINDGGHVYTASFHPDGPTCQYFCSNAFLSFNGPGGDYLEWHDDPMSHWYDDVGLSATRDGGAVFYWSQSNERFGLFALRFNAAGQVTGVEPGASRLALERVRFVSGAGVRAAVTTAGAARLELFDLAGRRIVSEEIAGIGDHTLAGTRDLPAGLYFARLSATAGTASAKVMVAR